MKPKTPPLGEPACPVGRIVIYKASDGKTQLDVKLEEETVWLTQAQMMILFQTTKQNVSLHINNIFKEGELSRNSVVKEYLTTVAGCSMLIDC
jgi:hypothetical protein